MKVYVSRSNKIKFILETTEEVNFYNDTKIIP